MLAFPLPGGMAPAGKEMSTGGAGAQSPICSLKGTQQEWKQCTNMGTMRCVVRQEREKMHMEYIEHNDPNLSWQG